MAITTASAWKTYRGVADTTYDAVVASAIAVVQDKIERFLGFAVDSATYTDQPHDGTGTETLYLNAYPVTAVSAVKILSNSGTTTTLASSEYRADLNTYNTGKIVRLSGGFGWPEDGCGAVWPEGFQNILVTYTAGWATIPDDLQYAAWVLIDTVLAGQGVDVFAMQTTEGNETRAARSAEDALQIYRQLLGPYRRMP